MRLSELAERSGVAIATIKYYLREGLLPPGERISATRAEYGEEHLRRLRLVRALIQVGGVSVAGARAALEAVDDEERDHHDRLGAAVWALPHEPWPEEDDPAVQRALGMAVRLQEELGWHRESASPPEAMLVRALASLIRLGYPCEPGNLLPYGRAAAELARHDLDAVESFGPRPTQLEAAVALTVLYEPVLLSLRRLADAEESRRRFADRSVAGRETATEGRAGECPGGPGTPGPATERE